jgi:hypothetical protein
LVPADHWNVTLEPGRTLLGVGLVNWAGAPIALAEAVLVIRQANKMTSEASQIALIQRAETNFFSRGEVDLGERKPWASECAASALRNEKWVKSKRIIWSPL